MRSRGLATFPFLGFSAGGGEYNVGKRNAKAEIVDSVNNFSINQWRGFATKKALT